jgi:DNA-directed RNA polymerase specialized sigma24 family protein
VWLHDVEGYTAEEMTERFGCNAACLRQRLHRARKRLRELLE